MSREPTVLVLGAGASAPYGFPVGRELVLQIFKELNGAFTDFAKSLRELDFKFEDLSSFRDDLYHSNQPSIDTFLENRPEYLKMGKVAIARALIPYEQEGSLSRNDWYEYLFGVIGKPLRILSYQ